jgi:hypothetical protein
MATNCGGGTARIKGWALWVPTCVVRRTHTSWARIAAYEPRKPQPSVMRGNARFSTRSGVCLQRTAAAPASTEQVPSVGGQKNVASQTRHVQPMWLPRQEQG